MKRQITVISLALAVCALVSTWALANSGSHTLKFTEDTTVNGTLIKKGDYRAKFNAETGEFTIKDAYDGDVVVTVKATEQPIEKKAEFTKFETVQGQNGLAMLKSVTFHGEHQKIVLMNNDLNTAGE